MSRWSDQFESHPIHEALSQIKEWIKVDVADVDSEHEAEKRRLTKAIDKISEVIAGLDPEFYPEGLLNNLNSNLRQVQFWSELSSYSSNGNVGHLVNANGFLNSQIHTVYELAAMSIQAESREAIRAAETAFDEFTRVIEKSEVEFKEKVAESATVLATLESRTEELSSSVTNLKSTTNTQIASWQQEFTEAQTKRIEEFSESQIARSRKYEEELASFKETAEAELELSTQKHNEALTSVFDTYNADVESKSEVIETKHEEILNLHGLVTTDGVAGGYKKGADGEWWAATIWSGISMLCYSIILIWVLFKGKLGFGIASLGSQAPTDQAATEFEGAGSSVAETILTIATSGTDWPLVVTTLSVTAVAFVAAQYAGRQSRVHRTNEQRLRWFSFEIAAIDPFISTLAPAQQQELKRQLTEKLFGQDRVVEEHPSKSTEVDAGALKNMMEQITQALKSIGDKSE